MTYATFPTDLTLYNERISKEDSLRQEQATVEILARLARQPGVVLADEVGMGKTFVALATAVSVLAEREDAGPVVVMSPSSLRKKWPRDWEVFNEKCLSGPLQNRFRVAQADTGVEFLRLLDDTGVHMKHIILLTHGALNRSIGDHWVKLAVIKRAFKGRSTLSAEREAFPRFAGRLLRAGDVERRAPDLLGDLIDRPYEDWLRVIHRQDPPSRDTLLDDPVPGHLADALEEMSGEELEGVIKGLRDLPLRESDYISERLTEARRAISKAMEDVWKVALRRARFGSPLLILDEAHHVKNPATKLSSLFASDDSKEDAQYIGNARALAGKFERMLFLTATPFQLGHKELIEVLQRFEGIAWKGNRAPDMKREEFRSAIVALGERMDAAQAAALRLDRSWARLSQDDVVGADGQPRELEEWWEEARQATGEGVLAQVVAQVANTRKAMESAEEHLAPWVLRYLKLTHLPDHPGVVRRRVFPGAAIQENGNADTGLGISASVLLPFLLAGRAQTLFAKSSKGRAMFADGLSSSFEAYLETRAGKATPEEDSDASAGENTPELEWYLDHLDRSLPRDDTSARSAHPKIHATAERAVALWRAGEKVLIFCHYRATGRALRQHVSALLHDEITRLGRERLVGQSDKQVLAKIDAIGERFYKDKRLQKTVAGWVGGIVGGFPALDEHSALITEVVLRFVRTPSFVVRYLPLDAKDLAKAFVAAVDSQSNGRRPLRAEIEQFCRFLADRCIEDERRKYLDALDSVQTGTHFGRDVTARFDPHEGHSDAAGAILLPNVRLANGEVREETRQRLLLTFNTPLYPEILIASSVMAEGVDLHLNCRYVIHHDLCWNPSTLEQRSGRVDRIGSKAERDGKSIHLYMPYVAATQDEKMFRVVRDRERWFQVIMGEQYAVDEASTDRQANRVLLPRKVAEELTLKLHP